MDPLAIAVDWLDAYRAQSIERLLSIYDDHATLACGCGGQKHIAGKEALRAYWKDRFNSYPALALDDLQPDGDAVTVSYETTTGVVRASLFLNKVGKITYSTCGALGTGSSVTRIAPPLSPT